MPFDFTSGNPDNLTGGGPARMQDIQGPLYDIRAYLNALGGITGGAGAAIIPAAETRSNVAYGMLGTPDRVSGLIIPAGAEIEVSYMAQWQRDQSAADARAA